MNSLRQIRERKGLTLTQLSGKTSISLRTLGEYEESRKEIPPVHLRSLAKALWVSPDDLTRSPQPATPAEAASPPVAAPPPEEAASAPAATVEAAPAGVSEAQAAAGPAEAAPVAAPPPVSRTARPRAPMPARPTRPILPITPGQIEDITHLAEVLGISGDDLTARLGKPVAEATRPQARLLIGQLRAEAAAAGVKLGRPRSVREQPDYEEKYLGQLCDQGAVLLIRLFTGEQFRGRIVDFTPYVIAIREEGGAEVVLRKLAMTDYRVVGMAASPTPAPGEASEGSEGSETSEGSDEPQ